MIEYLLNSTYGIIHPFPLIWRAGLRRNWSNSLRILY